MLEMLLLFGGGGLAGTLGGLLGIGGGIVVMPLLRFGVGLSAAQAAGTCILAVFCTTLGGTVRHLGSGRLPLRPLVPVLLAGTLASLGASLAFPALAARERWLDLLIGLVFVLVAGRMVLEGIGRLARTSEADPGSYVLPGSLPRKIGVGLVAGILPGLVGIGSGGILVPAFTFLLAAPIRTAMAASLACFCGNAAVSASCKFAQGYIDLAVALPICLGTLFGAGLGVTLNRRCSSSALRVVFGLLFLGVAGRFLLAGLGGD